MARKIYLPTLPANAAPEVRAVSGEQALLRLLARKYDWLFDDKPVARPIS